MNQLRWCVAGAAGTLIALASSLSSQEPKAVDSRLEKMSRRAGTLKMTFPELPDRRPPQLLKSPVLRCNDPTREEMDGAVWLWVDGQRPVAVLCLLFYATGKWNYEHLSLTDEALEVTGRPNWSWKPKAARRSWASIDQPVPDAPRARQQAMRALVRQFEASELRRGEKFPLRLLERPIYSYADPDHGVTDAALFAISNGTNPEILVQIEARQEQGKRQWQVAFDRLTAAEATVKLDGKELWKIPATNSGKQDPRDPYYAVNELGDLE